MSNTKTAVVTGGAGFIGSHLVDALVTDGCVVHVIDNLSTGKRENVNNKAIFHEIDIVDADMVAGVFAKLGAVDTVFHCAAMPQVQFSMEHPAETEESNVGGLVNILVEARAPFRLRGILCRLW